MFIGNRQVKQALVKTRRSSQIANQIWGKIRRKIEKFPVQKRLAVIFRLLNVFFLENFLSVVSSADFPTIMKRSAREYSFLLFLICVGRVANKTANSRISFHFFPLRGHE